MPATSSRIFTASASQNAPSLRYVARYSFSDFDSRQRGPACIRSSPCRSRLRRDRADRRELVARHVHVTHARVRERLETRRSDPIRRGEGDELVLHRPYRTQAMRVYLAGPPFGRRYRRRGGRTATGRGATSPSIRCGETSAAARGPRGRDRRGRRGGHRRLRRRARRLHAPDEGTAMEAWYAAQRGSA